MKPTARLRMKAGRLQQFWTEFGSVDDEQGEWRFVSDQADTPAAESQTARLVTPKKAKAKRGRKAKAPASAPDPDQAAASRKGYEYYDAAPVTSDESASTAPQPQD